MGPEDAAEVSGAGAGLEEGSNLEDSRSDITGTLEMEGEHVDGSGWGDADLDVDGVGEDGVLHALRLSLARLPHEPHLPSSPGSFSDLDAPLSEASIQALPGTVSDHESDIQEGSSELSSAVARIPEDHPRVPKRFEN